MSQKTKRDLVLQTQEPENNPRLNNVARLGEELAAEWLMERGYRVLERNWRDGRYGEIDIVAEDPYWKLLVVVEVKTRRLEARHRTFTLPPDAVAEDYSEEKIQGFEAINWRKKRKLMYAARAYIATCKFFDESCRLDAIVVTYRAAYVKDGQQMFTGTSILHVPGAFCDY